MNNFGNGFGGQGNGFGNAGFGGGAVQGGGFGQQAGGTPGFGAQQGSAGFGAAASFGQGAQQGFNGFGGGAAQGSFAQRNLGNNFNLLAPVNAGAVDVARVNAIKTIMTGAESAINNIILKLVSEHASKRATINDLFSGIDLKGCQLDIAYKTGIPMCPTFTLSKHISGGTSAGGFLGPGIGGMTVNGINTGSMGGTRNETGPAMKMEIIISKFVEAIDALRDLQMNESFEIRTPGCNINYIAQTGMLLLTPSTLVLNNNKNDARKIASNM